MDVSKRMQILKTIEIMERNRKFANRLGLNNKSQFDHNKAKELGRKR